MCRHCLRGSALFCGLRGNCVLTLCVGMEDEFARFQAELGALEQADTPGEGQQQKPVEAPTPHVVAPPVSAAQVSRPAVIARPAAPASVQAAAQLPGRRDHYGVRPLRPSLFTTHALTLTHATPHFQGPPTGAALPPPPAAFAPLPPAPVLPFAYRAPPLHPPPASHAAQQHGQQEKVVHVRSAAGEKWVDPTMADWPDSASVVAPAFSLCVLVLRLLLTPAPDCTADDHRIFVGNLGKEVTDEMLGRAFSKYATFQKAKAVRHAKSGEHKGYGFVSFGEIGDMVKALKEMDNKYIGNRPCKVRAGSKHSKARVASTSRTQLPDSCVSS